MRRPPFWVMTLTDTYVDEPANGWEINGLLKGFRGVMGNVDVYVSRLGVNQMPHEIHSHAEEEIIILLSGHLDILSPSGRVGLGPGSFFHHPPKDSHTIQSMGPETACFVILKWSWDAPLQDYAKAKTLIYNASTWQPATDCPGIQRHRISDHQPLGNGGRLACESIRIAPETGYPAHAHDHDLMLILLSGRVSGLGHHTKAPAIIYYPAGTPHALATICPEPIDLLAFEFHPPTYRLSASGR